MYRNPYLRGQRQLPAPVARTAAVAQGPIPDASTLPYEYVNPDGSPFNMQAGGVANPRTGRWSEAGGSSGQLFDARGQMNVGSASEALMNSKHVLDEVSAGRVSAVPRLRRSASNGRDRVWTPPMGRPQAQRGMPLAASYGPPSLYPNVDPGMGMGLTAGAHYASTMPEFAPHPWADPYATPYGSAFDLTAAFDLSAQEKDSILLEAYNDPEGFAIMGQQLINPVREVLDYEGFARRCLPIRLVRQGETVRYDKDPLVVAYTPGRDAMTPESRVRGRYVFPPPFEITHFATIELRDIFQAGFDILARIQDRSRQAVEKKEDDVFRGFLDVAARSANDTTFFATLNLAAIEAIRFQVERNRIPADKLLINRQEVSDLVTVLSSEVDPVTQRELVMGGYVGMVANMAIITSAGRNTFEVIQPGEVFCVTAPEYLGGMPVWVELFSEPVNQYNEGKSVRGWYWYMLLSMTILNNRGVSRGEKA